LFYDLIPPGLGKSHCKTYGEVLHLQELHPHHATGSFFPPFNRHVGFTPVQPTGRSIKLFDEKAIMITTILRSGLNAFFASIGMGLSILVSSRFIIHFNLVTFIIIGSVGAFPVLFGMSILQKKSLHLTPTTLVIQNVISIILILIVAIGLITPSVSS